MDLKGQLVEVIKKWIKIYEESEYCCYWGDGVSPISIIPKSNNDNIAIDELVECYVDYFSEQHFIEDLPTYTDAYIYSPPLLSQLIDNEKYDIMLDFQNYVHIKYFDDVLTESFSYDIFDILAYKISEYYNKSKHLCNSKIVNINGRCYFAIERRISKIYSKIDFENWINTFKSTITATWGMCDDEIMYKARFCGSDEDLLELPHLITLKVLIHDESGYGEYEFPVVSRKFKIELDDNNIIHLVLYQKGLLDSYFEEILNECKEFDIRINGYYMISGGLRNKVEKIINVSHTYKNLKITEALSKKETLELANKKDEMTTALYNDDIMRKVVDPKKVNFYSNSVELLDGMLVMIKNVSDL